MTTRSTATEGVDFFKAALAGLSNDKGLRFHANGEAVIRCPYHGGGQERTPSLGINLGKNPSVALGVFHCFSCHAAGPWNKLARDLNLPMLEESRDDPDSFAFPHAAVAALLGIEGCPDKPKLKALTPWPASKEWRQVSGETLVQFRAKKWSFKDGSPCVYLPVLVNGSHVGGIRARIRKESSDGIKRPSYLNLSGTWAAKALFGYDLCRDSSYEEDPLWIVEGPRDTLWCHQNGIRAVGLMGSAATPGRIRLIEELDPRLVVIATDNDEAGNRTAVFLRKEMKRLGIPVRRLVLPEGRDPCNMSPSFLQRAKAALQ